MTKFELIDKIIVDLNNLTVHGVQNMQIVLTAVQNLSVLKDGLSKEDEARNKKEQDGQEEPPTE